MRNPEVSERSLYNLFLYSKTVTKSIHAKREVHISMLNKKNILVFILIISVILFYNFSNMGCPILFFTGIPCLGCGMTRACVSMIQLDFISAFYYHPLCFLLPAAAMIVMFQRKISRKVYQRCLVGIVAAFIIVYIIRLLNPVDAIIKINIHNSVIFKVFHMLL